MDEIELLRQHKEKIGRSYEYLAQKIGVSFRTVYRWLNEGTKPHPFMLKRIKEYLRNNS